MSEDYGTSVRCDQRTETTNRGLPADTRARLLSRAMIAPDGCWLWSGPVNNRGYGTQTTTGGVKERATLLVHRALYELYNGPIPEGLQLDHLCRVRRCVNPGHLEPVTCRENIMRSPIAVAAINAAKTHCAQGHEYSPSNTIWSKTSAKSEKRTRKCRTCRNEIRRESYRGQA